MYTPTVLTILGVILYLRMGWVAGSVGPGRTVLIVVLANAITFVTTLSFSAVATNIHVGVGGAYYIVSRSLGLEIGGAVGLPLFLSQAFSVTLYSFGLAEALKMTAIPGLPLAPAAAVIVILVAALSLRGARMALATQVPLLIAIAVSLLALGWGALFRPTVGPAPGAAAAPGPAPGFWVVFAVFFPAVTGVMAGLGLSGDLRSPGVAIPRGAIWATLTGFAVYLAVPFLLVVGATPAALRADSLIWTKIAPYGAWLVLPGLVGAVFSSAVGSALGAPRTLQALARDQLAPARFARLGRKVPEPVLGIFLTTAIALGGVFLGGLNAVAPVVAMFFLTIYGTVNLVAALESLAGDPSWRPKFRIPWAVSLVGALACGGVMFLISPTAAAIALAVELLIWALLTRREFKADWGDLRRGAFESLIRWSLIRLDRRPMMARNWRPHLLVYADDVERRLDLVRYGTWFSGDHGIVTVAELIVGEILDEDIDPRARREWIRGVLDREGLVAFPEVDVVRNVISGIVAVTQANGIAGLESNTVLLGWPREPERLADFLRVIRRLTRIHKSAIIGRVGERWNPREGELPLVHIWWGGLQQNGDLMLLLAHLLTRNPEWRNGRIRLMSIAPDEEAAARRRQGLHALVRKTRIAAEPRVRVLGEEDTVPEVIRQESACADVVFLGLDVPGPGKALAYAERLRELSRDLRTVFFVKNATPFAGELAG